MGIVLIVDDDADNRDTLAEVLADEGYQVKAIGGAAEALALLQAGERCDLILLDLVMPGMSGDELIVRLGETQPGHAPIVVLSAVQDWTAPPGVKILKKPVSLTQMLDTVRAHVTR